VLEEHSAEAARGVGDEDLVAAGRPDGGEVAAGGGVELGDAGAVPLPQLGDPVPPALLLGGAEGNRLGHRVRAFPFVAEVAVAPRPAGEDHRRVVVEGGEQPVYVVGDARLTGSRRGLGRVVAGSRHQAGRRLDHDAELVGAEEARLAFAPGEQRGRLCRGKATQEG